MKPTAYDCVAPDSGRYLIRADGDQQPQGWSKSTPLYAFKLKLLDWTVDSDGDLTAKTPFGLFEVMHMKRANVFVFMYKLKDHSHHGTMDDAKAAAEKFYAALIGDLFESTEERA